MVDHSLKGQYIVIPESRQLDVLEGLLLSRAAKVERLPLVSILDTPDPGPVNAWLREFIDSPCDYFVILTGEGLRRLDGFAARAGCLDAYHKALADVARICRGPKPGRVLRDIGLKPDILGQTPTTSGIIATLSALDLAGRRVAVQLYGEEPNRPLMEFLAGQGAEVLTVAPYVYAPAIDEQRVVAFLSHLDQGKYTAIMFTSQPQFRRLENVARKHGMEGTLYAGLRRLLVVAVGPVVADQLASAGLPAQVMPEGSYFMKPMVTALARHLQGT